MSLTGILHHMNSFFTAEVQERLHVYRLAVKMHRDHRLGFARIYFLNGRNIQEQTLGLRICQYRHGPDGSYGQRGRNERIGRQYDFIAGNEVKNPQSQRQRVQARIDANSEFCPCESGELFFKFLNFSSQNKFRLTHLKPECRFQLALKFFILFGEVKKRDRLHFLIPSPKRKIGLKILHHPMNGVILV